MDTASYLNEALDNITLAHDSLDEEDSTEIRAELDRMACKIGDMIDLFLSEEEYPGDAMADQSM